MKILAIESSCDETAASVVENGRNILSSVVNTQIAEHTLYGGVVPEIASRRHLENIVSVVDGALEEASLTFDEIDAIAVTTAPGLIGALLVGVNYAKGLALASGKPLIPVHHIRGHIAANYLAHKDLEPPFICLVISGGHTHIIEVLDYTKFNIIGKTMDDAAGEAFDKAGRAMGFPYPAGAKIDKAAKEGERGTYKIPHPKLEGKYDFSFSGIKTAVVNIVHNAEQKGEKVIIPNLACDFQSAVSEILADKFVSAAKEYGYKKAVICGGVSANSGVRNLLEERFKKEGIEFFVPPLSLCGDNAAMIGSQGYYEALQGHFANMELNASATMNIEKEF